MVRKQHLSTAAGLNERKRSPIGNVSNSLSEQIISQKRRQQERMTVIMDTGIATNVYMEITKI